MRKRIEQKQVINALSGTKIVRVDVTIVDGRDVAEINIISEIIEEFPKKEEIKKHDILADIDDFDELFPIVEASKLSLEDSFLQYEPKKYNQKILKKNIVKAIESGISDFRRPIMDPTEDERKSIGFKAGSKPLTGHSAYWWVDEAEMLMPSKNSRIGTKKQYVAFLGVLIKYLIEKQGYEVSEAWNAVCNDSKDLGHYQNSKNRKEDMEPTGSRRFGKWYDLANTCKIIREDRGPDLLLASGYYKGYSYYCPLSSLRTINNPSDDLSHSVGWIVLDV